MAIHITIDPAKLTFVREQDSRVQSYNIEMTELTGGTFWKPYTQGQIEGTEEFPAPTDLSKIMELLKGLHVKFPEIDLYEPRIRTLAKELGPVIIRFSGSWATRTYYDFDGHTGGVVPEGFEFVLTREQWQGALDFAKEVNAQILVSVANSFGVHENGTGAWQPDQARLLWDYTAQQGMTIDYAEFMNEPNLLSNMMLPEGYGPAEFGRDHDLFAKWLKENHPETKLVGPCAADSPRGAMMGGTMLNMVTSKPLLDACTIMPKIFSYHSYNGISERGQFFGAHHAFSEVLTEKYLGLTMEDCDYYKVIRDQYAPGADLWVTESADAACGGNTWAPTYVETIRYVDELARFGMNARGVIFHNTLASSAYGLLDSETHEPRPQYWGGLLFAKLAGTTAYDTHEPIREGVHLYAYSRKDGKEGVCYIYVNNSQTETVSVDVPDCVRYTLSSDKLRSQRIMLNGKVLQMPDEHTMPVLDGQDEQAGTITLEPCTITFLVV